MSVNIDYYSLFRSTLDIDTNDKETIKRITQKIIRCPNIFHIHKKPSSHKGYHFILRCYIKCDICRICYDDFRRYNYDMNRPEWARNILFDIEEDYEKTGENDEKR